MSAGKLRHTLVVRHPETGDPTALVVGESVPDWASGLVHKDDLEPGSSEAKKAPAKKSASSKSEK